MKVVCVYRTGGDFNAEYVLKLRNAVKRYLTVPYDFICMTDDLAVRHMCKIIPLKYNWKGWWSKIELFRPDLPKDDYIYFDLDTVILKNINDMAKLAQTVPFAMFNGFQPVDRPGYSYPADHPASGIMTGKLYEQSKVYEIFKENPEKHIASVLKGDRRAGMQGDQGYIIKILGYDIPKVQDYFPDDYFIGKTSETKRGRFGEAHVLVWTGQPRLNTITAGKVMKKWRRA